MSRVYATVAAVLLLASACSGQTGPARDSADLGTVVPDCGEGRDTTPSAYAGRPLPALSGRVVDGAQILSAGTEARLIRQSEELEAKTLDQLVVVTIPALDGEAIEAFGLRAGRGWGVGQARLDNGVLLIVAPNDRKVRIEVGCGLEGLLTDERAAAIIELALLPRLRSGQYDEAMQAGASEIITILRSEVRRPMRKIMRKAA